MSNSAPGNELQDSERAAPAEEPVRLIVALSPDLKARLLAAAEKKELAGSQLARLVLLEWLDANFPTAG